jgi:hypothetical protein
MAQQSKPHHVFESVASAAVRRRLSSIVNDAKQKPNVAAVATTVSIDIWLTLLSIIIDIIS